MSSGNGSRKSMESSSASRSSDGSAKNSERRRLHSAIGSEHNSAVAHEVSNIIRVICRPLMFYMLLFELRQFWTERLRHFFKTHGKEGVGVQKTPTALFVCSLSRALAASENV